MNKKHDRNIPPDQLIERALNGDKEAITGLYTLYDTRLINAAKTKLGKILRNQLEYRDIVQSVWKDALDDLDNFKYKGPNSFYRWLLKILTNKVQYKGRYYAARKRDPAREQRFVEEKSSLKQAQPTAYAKDPTPSKAASVKEELTHVTKLLERFPETHQKILVLRIRDELEFHEIGKQVNKSTEAVRKIFNRSLKQLISFSVKDNLDN